jgi:GT2 family glycosyltransferase
LFAWKLGRLDQKDGQTRRAVNESTMESNLNPKTPKAYCILLNWNGWRDTIECLESLFRLNDLDYRVVVCDNSSSDPSMEKIGEWARGEIEANSANPQLQRLICPPVAKPIPYRELTREEAESGTADCDARLVLIQNGANLGFAGGNNVGLRYALSDADCSFFWMLNNDTVVEADALAAMVRHMQEHPDIGLCGSLNLSYRDPNAVQAEGGMRYSRWTGRVPKRPRRTIDDLTSTLARMDYVNGASMLASRAFLERVGLMEESYFLYFEEMDWAMRAKGKFRLGYARESIIYHKEGAAIGTNQDRRKRSLVSEKYLSRNRVLFTRRFVPWALPSVIAFVTAAAAERFCMGDFAKAKIVLSSMFLGMRDAVPAGRDGRDMDCAIR